MTNKLLMQRLQNKYIMKETILVKQEELGRGDRLQIQMEQIYLAHSKMPVEIHRANRFFCIFIIHIQCFSWVGTAFPQIFPCVLISVKVEITPPVHYATS
jgi:hypothetical protein